MKASLLKFIHAESSAGIVLMITAAIALVINNIGLSGLYTAFLSTPIHVQIGELIIAKPMLLWINDGLMAIFFFLIGLEIKREVVEGQLSSKDKAILPFVAAIGGMVAPAAVFMLLNGDIAENRAGWAIPAATDIAFALGLLALIGTRAPITLKVMLLAIAIIDDLLAIGIIALFYTSKLSMLALGLAAICFAGLLILNRTGVMKIAPYVLIGIVMWVCVLKSGVHATLAGVMTAFCVPLSSKDKSIKSPLKKIEHGLHPWVAFLILPVFAFANAGISFAGITMDQMMSPLTLGIALGLFVGKQIGVFGAAFLAVKTGIAKLPEGLNWAHIYGLSLITGVGFTMSLFIGGLAFDNQAQMDSVKLGVLAGSFMSAVVGMIVLTLFTGYKAPEKDNSAVKVQAA